MARLTPPLNPNLEMVDEEGKPTPFFLRWWQDQVDTNSSIPTLETAAQVSAVLDIINPSVTWGSILFRGETIWDTLDTGTSGQVLTTNGPSAAPSWTTLAIPDVLDDLSDVDTTGVTDGQVLTYQVVSGVGSWGVATPSTGGGGGTSEVGTPNYIRNIVYAVDVSQDPDSAAIETDLGPRTTSLSGTPTITGGTIVFDGTDYTVYPTGADLELGLRDFSIKIGKFSTPSIATTQGIASHWNSSGTQRGWIIRTSGSSINVLVSTTGSDFPTVFTGATTLSSDTEYDIEWRRVDGTFELLIDGVVDATDTTSYDINLPSSQGLEIGNYDSSEIVNLGTIQSFSLAFLNDPPDTGNPTESIIVAASDETTALTTGTGKVTFRMPYAFTLSEVRASVTTAPTGAVLTVDINEGGVSVLSTKLTIDATENTSTTAATAAVISDASLADDAEITIDIDTIGSTEAGRGLKVTLIGTQT